MGKSSVLELIANVLHGNDVDHYDFSTLDHTRKQGGLSHDQSQTNSARLYELTSSNGITVRTGVCEQTSMRNRFLRFASSTHPG